MEPASGSTLGSWARNGLLVGGVVGAGILSETGADGGFIKDIWAALKTATPPVAMVLFILWLDERRDRKAAERNTYQLATSGIEQMADFEKTVEAMRQTQQQAIQFMTGQGNANSNRRNSGRR